MTNLVSWINNNGIISSVVVGVCVIFLKDIILAITRWLRRSIKNKVLFNKKIKIIFSEMKFWSYWIRVLCKKVNHKDELQRPIEFKMKPNWGGKSFDDIEYVISICINKKHNEVLKIGNKKKIIVNSTRRISQIEEKAWNKYFISIGRPILSEQCLEYKNNELNKLRRQLSGVSKSINNLGGLSIIPPHIQTKI